MHRLATLVALAVLAVTPLAGAQSADRAGVDRAIAAVYPSLVRISAVVVDHRDGREVSLEVTGSGTIISPDGYIVTNHHVVGRARRIVCTLPDREEVRAELIGTDPLTDIAVIRLAPSTPRTFPAARFGDSATVRRGETVLAMGSPRALSQSVTLGVVSNTEMTMPGRGSLDLDGEDVGSIVRWIGHDAAIQPGNSGGPLVNLRGEIVGVNEISLGLGGAIPGNLARRIADALIRDGRVRRSWTGVDVQPLVGPARNAGRGVLVASVSADSPAAAAGVRAGDVLVRVNDQAVDARFAEQLPLVNQTLFDLPIGRPVRMALLRDGSERLVTLTPLERPAATSAARELRDWGLVGANLSAFEALDLGRATTAGVRVIGVRRGGPAELARPMLLRDDVIVAVEHTRIGSVAELEAATRAQRGDRPRASVLVTFERGREQRLTVVELAGDPPPEIPPAESKKAWLDVDSQALTPLLADRMGLRGRAGIRITGVSDPAIPLRVGDIVAGIDGQPLRSAAATDEDLFPAAIRRYAIGTTVVLRVYRDGRDIDVPVTLAASPAVAREMKRHDETEFGFRARDMADADRRDRRFDDTMHGVLVDGVSQGSWASLGQLVDGDVILAVDGQPIAGVDDLARQMAGVRARRPASVVLFVRRGVRTLFLELQPTWR